MPIPNIIKQFMKKIELKNKIKFNSVTVEFYENIDYDIWTHNHNDYILSLYINDNSDNIILLLKNKKV